MQKLINKKTEDKKQSEQFFSGYKLTIDEIEEFYLNKNYKEPLYGLEYERISIDLNSYKNADYKTMGKIIEHFCDITRWDIIYDGLTIIAAKSRDNSSISLEPGSQIEISIAPKKSILDIDVELTKIIDLIDKIGKIYNVIFLGYGMTPSSNVDEIEILPKKRYKIMNEYLPYCKYGELCPKMMRKTASIQVNIDYKDKKDAYLKLKFYNLIMPFMSALCANSPFENNQLTSIPSNRCKTWLYTGENRCGFFYQNIFKTHFKKFDNVFKNYIKQILNVPMIYIEREGKIIPIKGKINFYQFLKEGYQGFKPSIEDYNLHQSLCFPDVRLKNYIEIRNHDSSNKIMALALCAFYKGLNSINIDVLLKKFHYLKLKNLNSYSKKLSDYGLSTKINSKYDGWDIVSELLEISKTNLTMKERLYLEPIFDIIQKRKTQADIIIDYGFQNTSDIVDFIY